MPLPDGIAFSLTQFYCRPFREPFDVFRIVLVAGFRIVIVELFVVYDKLPQRFLAGVGGDALGFFVVLGRAGVLVVHVGFACHVAV